MEDVYFPSENEVGDSNEDEQLDILIPDQHPNPEPEGHKIQLLAPLLLGGLGLNPLMEL